MKIELKTNSMWLVPALLTAAVLAGCMGRNGMFPWSESEAKDSLEHVTAATFDERVLKCDKPVLVDFYAEWCGPCRQLTPRLEEFAQEHPEVRVVKVNVDNSPELARRYGVKAMPTLLVIRDGKVAKKRMGADVELAELVASDSAKGKSAAEELGTTALE
jgi:thioredoxin 1